MEEGLPEEDSEQSREGQLLHDYSAHPEYERKMLKPKQQDLLALADDLTKQVIETIGSSLELKDKSYVEEIEKTYRFGGFDDGIKECKIQGTPDYVRFYDLISAVIDRKFGYNVVESADLNLQLRVYAVLTSSEHSFVAIVQPRAPYDQRITIAEYNSDDITASRKQIISILDKSEKPDAPLIAGEEQCRYCKAKLICPAFREAFGGIVTTTGISYDTGLSKAKREAMIEHRMTELSDEELEQVFVAKTFAKWVDQPCNEEIRRRKANGADINFEIGKDFEVREVADVRKAITLLSLSGLNKESVWECVTEMSLDKVSEILRNKHKDWTWKQAKDWIDKKLASVIELAPRKGRVMHK